MQRLSRLAHSYSTLRNRSGVFEARYSIFGANRCNLGCARNPAKWNSRLCSADDDQPCSREFYYSGGLSHACSQFAPSSSSPGKDPRRKLINRFAPHDYVH